MKEAMFLHELLQGMALINDVITSTPYGTYQPAETVRTDGLESLWEVSSYPLLIAARLKQDAAADSMQSDYA